eukprot:11011399-Heterocapsa_arctica.AAC.1
MTREVLCYAVPGLPGDGQGLVRHLHGQRRWFSSGNCCTRHRRPRSHEALQHADRGGMLLHLLGLSK